MRSRTPQKGSKIVRKTTIEEKQKAEIEFWRDCEEENPESDSLEYVIRKFSTAAILLACLNRVSEDLVKRDGRILELGAGQGWASCFYKRLYPDNYIITTDISEYAVMSLHNWESLIGVSIDNSYACKSYEIDESDASLDMVFCYSSAHHFIAHRRTLEELRRVLRPGGRAIYLHEPATPAYLHTLAKKRVNRKRPMVPEDVLVTSKLRELSIETGFNLKVDFFPSLIQRGPIEMMYFSVLNRLPFLQQMLPCSANFIFTRQSS